MRPEPPRSSRSLGVPHDSVGNTHNLEESRPVPIPKLLELVASMGDSAREALARGGVTIRAGSRIELASTCLRSAAAVGRVNATPEEVAPLLHALWVALDFADISAYLPKAHVKSIRKELAAATRGALWPTPGRRQPLQLQTQHWIGAVLTR